jgi:hypothetical protein
MTKETFFNASQSLIHLINANVCHNLWPRAEGKTSGGAGRRLVRLSQVMPRSQCILYTDTYERCTTVLIPGILSFLESEMGLVENQDYIKFKKPPDNWIKPLIAPGKYDRVVTFRTGFTLGCGASDTDGSVNGFNAQSAIIDETKYVDRKRIKSQLFKALRGCRSLFEHLPEYRSVWSFTDKYEGDIEWLLQMRDKQDINLINSVLSEALYIEALRQRITEFTSTSTIYKYNEELHRRETRLNAIRRELVYVCDAKPFSNKEILGNKFYRDALRDCESKYEFNVAILNQDPDNVENTYYPGLNKKQQHKHMNDTTEEQTLVCSMDYQWKITPMVVGQWGILPGESEFTYNIVNGVHTLHPVGGIKQTVHAFCEYYKDRQDKYVYYVYDHTATARRPDGVCFKDLAIEAWEEAGWGVIAIYIGGAPEQNQKFEQFKPIMLANKIRYNEVRAWAPLKSIKHAGTKRVGKETKKDKDAEKKVNDPIKQTDYSDAFDMQIWAALVQERILPEKRNEFYGDIALA